MAITWDQRSPAEQQRHQNVLLRQSVLQMALGHVPYVRTKLATLGLDARLFKGLEELDRFPLTMRRDILDLQRNPDGARAVILRGTAEGVKRFSDRSVLRRVALARLFGGEDVQELAIEAATRPIHMHLVDGPGGRIPVAYTRDDLDLLARAGARLGQLVGVAREDRLLNLVPFAPTLSFWGIFYMAHGMGMSAVHGRTEGLDMARAVEALDDARATAVAVTAEEAPGFATAAREAKIDLSELRVLVAVGRSLTSEERLETGEALAAAGAPLARIAAAYAPGEGHVLWGECAVPAGRTETFGFHTFPDLELLEVVSPETGERQAEEAPGEIVVTPLGFRGGGVPRWRTGDLALGGQTNKPCPNCGRSVPRVGPTVRRDAWQHTVNLNGRTALIDLRDAAAAAAERAADWQVELLADGDAHALFVYLASSDEPGPIIDLYEDLARMRSPVSQIILGSPEQLSARQADAPGPWRRLVVRT
ncbi:MAG TPA: hypothetical protein VGB52_12455 [Actinomycetota bacterium]